MKKILIVFVILVVLGGVGYGMIRNTSSPQVTSSPIPVTGQERIFTVVGSDFAFDVKEITVNKGDTVTIIFQNAEGIHDWVIDAFNARTPRIGPGTSAQVTFVADTAGSFEYYCSVGEHRQRGMWGTLTVK